MRQSFQKLLSNCLAGRKLSTHLLSSLFVQIVDHSQTNELHNSAKQIQTGNQPAHIVGCCRRLCDRSFACLIAQDTHNQKNQRGTYSLCQLTEEGMQCINSAFLTGAKLPLIVVDGIAHHSPAYAGVHTHTKAVNYQTDQIEDQSQIGVTDSGEDQHKYAADERYDRAENGSFLLAKLYYDLLNKGDFEGYKAFLHTFFKEPEKYQAPKGGETLEHLCERTTAYLYELANDERYQDSTVLLATHGAALRGLLSSFQMNGDLKNFWGKSLHKNCAVTLMEAKDGKITLLEEGKIYYEENEG